MLFSGSPAFQERPLQCCGWRDGHVRRGGLPHEFNLRRGQAVGLIDQLAERALQAQGFGGEGAGGLNGSGVLLAQGKEAGGGLVAIVRTDTRTTLAWPIRVALGRPKLWLTPFLTAALASNASTVT